MNDADIYRENAQLFSEAANAAADEQVRVTLLRLARSALQTAAEMETSQDGESPTAGAESEEKKLNVSPK
jgi:hypothetical protein